jgi:hypothetical protein
MKIYIDLFHGRKSLSENLDGWGETGPIIGPFDSVSFTYMYHIRLNDKDNSIVLDLPVVGDCVFYDGMLYGDFCIFHEDFFIERPDQKIRLQKPKLNDFGGIKTFNRKEYHAPLHSQGNG